MISSPKNNKKKNADTMEENLDKVMDKAKKPWESGKAGYGERKGESSDQRTGQSNWTKAGVQAGLDSE